MKFVPQSLKTFYWSVLGNDHARLPLPWHRVGRGGALMDRLHRLALRLESRRSGCRWKAAVLSLATPVTSCLQATRLVAEYGGPIEKQFGVGRRRQWLQIVYAANVLNIAPLSYYKFRLWEPANWSKRRLWIQHHENVVLLPWLNRRIDRGAFDDKRRFFRACRAAGIPTAPVIATLGRADGEQWPGDAARLPRRSLFVKLADRWCGEGAERWDYDGVADRWGRGGAALTHDGLLAHLRAKAGGGPVVVQPRLANHPGLEPLSNGSLCTVRVVTYRLAGQPPALLLAALRMPVGAAEVDNFHAGGITAAVSAAGQLQPAIGLDPGRFGVTHHPDTLTPIAGRPLPHWRDLVELAKQAHERLGGPCFVGWDLAVTPDGPLVLEANTTWCFDHVQMTHRRPLGETPFPEVFAATARAEGWWPRARAVRG